jgi:hypothetical protein
MVLALLIGGGSLVPAAAQQRFKLGGGGGLAKLFDPVLDLGFGTNIEGFFGIRLNDNFSVEASVNFANITRVFTKVGNVVVETDVATVGQFQIEQFRYHLDGTLVYNFGRRQPFHPFVFVGGGFERRENKLFEPLADQDPIQIKTVTHDPTISFGAGLDFYFRYNVAARGDIRWWLPKGSFDERTRRFFAGVTYFF